MRTANAIVVVEGGVAGAGAVEADGVGILTERLPVATAS